MLEQADKVIDGLGGQFLDWVREDVDQLASALARAVSAPPMRGKILERISFIANDIKGQGTTFGYPLITEVCQSLCWFIGGADPDDPVTLGVVTAHIDSLKLIVREKMAGDGGDAGRQLIAALELAVQKVSG